MLFLLALAAAGLTVDADTLEVAEDGRWVARGAVKIVWRGAFYAADRAAYDPTLGAVTLSGNVRSKDGALEVACTQLFVGRGRIEANDAEVRLVDPKGELLAKLGAGHLIREGSDTVFSGVDFSLCNCVKRPWTISARRVEVLQSSERVRFSVPVFRVYDIPVLALPWWSMPNRVG